MRQSHDNKASGRAIHERLGRFSSVSRKTASLPPNYCQYSLDGQSLGDPQEPISIPRARPSISAHCSVGIHELLQSALSVLRIADRACSGPTGFHDGCDIFENRIAAPRISSANPAGDRWRGTDGPPAVRRVRSSTTRGCAHLDAHDKRSTLFREKFTPNCGFFRYRRNFGGWMRRGGIRKIPSWRKLSETLKRHRVATVRGSAGTF